MSIELETIIMPDGRPAYAWLHELEMLRAENKLLKSDERELRLKELMIAMKIVSIEWRREPWSQDILIRCRHDFSEMPKIVGRELINP